jgi:hypothetical protein
VIKLGDIQEAVSQLLLFISDHKKEIQEDDYNLYVEVLKRIMRILEEEEIDEKEEKEESIKEKATKYDKYLEKSGESNLNALLSYQIMDFKEKLAKIEPIEESINILIEEINGRKT